MNTRLPNAEANRSASSLSVRYRWLLLSCLLLGAGNIVAADFSNDQLEFFEKKIRPLLTERCYDCHSVGAKKLKGGVFLDSRDSALKGGDTRAAVVPGDPEKSLFIESITYKNQDLQMPPKNRLTDAQIADLTTWVKQGAPWPAESAPK
ncbi:MAG: c-type cytochrome domain-containing protein, partial [Roseimicrobium sp.]